MDRNSACAASLSLRWLLFVIQLFKGGAFSNMPAQQGCLLKICLVCYWGPAHTSVQGGRGQGSRGMSQSSLPLCPSSGKVGVRFLYPYTAREYLFELKGIQKLSSTPRRYATQIKVEMGTVLSDMFWKRRWCFLF